MVAFCCLFNSFILLFFHHFLWHIKFIQITWIELFTGNKHVVNGGEYHPCDSDNSSFLTSLTICVASGSGEMEVFMKRLSFIVLLIGLLVTGCSNTANTTPIAATAIVASSTSAPIQYYFPRAGQHPDQELIKVINSANKQLDIAIYSLTKKDIVNAIVAAKNRGVAVRLITDKQEASNKSQAQELTALSKAGISIKINTHKGLMHLKVTIADNNTVNRLL